MLGSFTINVVAPTSIHASFDGTQMKSERRLPLTLSVLVQVAETVCELYVPWILYHICLCRANWPASWLGKDSCWRATSFVN